jgi:hypothetical protein
MAGSYWLLLEKSDDTRVSQGIDAYKDRTGESYHYDSNVPNHKKMSMGDFVVIRKEGAILGIGEIADISEADDTKIHRRCPECDHTDIRERSSKQPKWKCGKCAWPCSSRAPDNGLFPVWSQRPIHWPCGFGTLERLHKDVAWCGPLS